MPKEAPLDQAIPKGPLYPTFVRRCRRSRIVRSINESWRLNTRCAHWWQRSVLVRSKGSEQIQCDTLRTTLTNRNKRSWILLERQLTTQRKSSRRRVSHLKTKCRLRHPSLSLSVARVKSQLQCRRSPNQQSWVVFKVASMKEPTLLLWLNLLCCR